jgi:hypothetical protein
VLLVAASGSSCGTVIPSQPCQLQHLNTSTDCSGSILGLLLQKLQLKATDFRNVHALQTKVQNALKNLEEYCTWMRVLGSYPVGI